ncbi:MAG: M20/M25/M40 family metallo-hydrolase [Rhodothermales bacterium]|nr:M20/M25/M40 family metallo-hydrolase [Rhodothermales bacterium]
MTPDEPPQTAALDLLAEMIRFRSLSREEGPLADFMAATVHRAGLPVERVEDNVYFALGDGEDRLLLASHLDVVPPAPDHPYDPFEPVVQGGRLYGRGAVDAKASGAAMTAALLELAAEGYRPREGQVIVALTACEESGGDCNGMQRLRSMLPPLSAALVGEPTHLQPCVAQKGLLILHVHAHGKAAHAARAHLGENALYRAARDLLRLEQHRFDREDPFLGRPTLTPTTIEGGTVRNVVPDHCAFYVDIRSTPAYTHAELTEEVAALVESEVRVHSDRLIPCATDPDARIVRACLRALPGAAPFGSPTVSDWIFLNDVPTVKIGPGDSRLSHTGEENIAVEEVARAVAAYKAIITTYFG